MEMESERVVTLVDMDCFYCQVETRLNPALKGKPMAVVQYNQWKGGGIIAVNYEARDFGVTRSMRGDEAKAKCPDITLVPVAAVRGKADLTKYRNAGQEVVNVLCQFSDCIQKASVDEAYIDITQKVEERMKELPRIHPSQLPNSFVVGFSDESNDEDARLQGLEKWLSDVYRLKDKNQLKLAVGGIVVEEMRAAVYAQTGFRCSAGIAHNKVLGKLACGLHKPNRQTILPQPSVFELFKRLPLKKVRNLGGKFGCMLKEELEVNMMFDLMRFSENQLQQRFDQKTGSWLYNLARGIDHEPVTPRLLSKSIGCCKKFPGRQALAKRQEVEYWLRELAAEVSERLEKDLEENKRRAKLLTVSYLQGSSCSRSCPLNSYDAKKIATDAFELLKKSNSGNEDTWYPPLKYLGLSVGKFVEEGSTLHNFFKTAEKPVNVSCSNATTETTTIEEQPDKKPKDESSLKNSFFIKYLKQKAEGNAVVPSKAMSSDEDMFDDEETKPGIIVDHDSTSKVLNSKLTTDGPSTSKTNASENTKINKGKHKECDAGASTSKSEDDNGLCVSISELFPNLEDVDDDVVELLPGPLQERLKARIEAYGKMPQKSNRCKDGAGKEMDVEITEKQVDVIGDCKQKDKISIHEEQPGQVQSTDQSLKLEKKTSGVKESIGKQKSKRKVKNSEKTKKSVRDVNSFVERAKENEDIEEFCFSQRQLESQENLQKSMNSSTVTVNQTDKSFEPIDKTSEDPEKLLVKNKNCQRSGDSNEREKENTPTFQKSSSRKHTTIGDLDAITVCKEDEGKISETTNASKEDLVEKCPQCNNVIPLVEYLEHLDFHAAELLHKELNRAPQPAPPRNVPAAEIPAKRKRGRSTKKGAVTVVGDKKMRSITTYFSPK